MTGFSSNAAARHAPAFAAAWRRQLRDRLGRKVSQGEVARLLGISRRQWQFYEAGTAPIPKQTRRAMRDVLTTGESDYLPPEESER